MYNWVYAELCVMHTLMYVYTSNIMLPLSCPLKACAEWDPLYLYIYTLNFRQRTKVGHYIMYTLGMIIRCGRMSVCWPPSFHLNNYINSSCRITEWQVQYPSKTAEGHNGGRQRWPGLSLSVCLYSARVCPPTGSSSSCHNLDGIGYFPWLNPQLLPVQVRIMHSHLYTEFVPVSLCG